MFILYAVIIGVAIGLLRRGRLGGLAEVRFRWAPLILIGFLTQVVLFSDAVAARVGDLGPPLYVASTAIVGLAVVRNIALPGMPLIVAGAVSNLVAILANGGFMPAAPGALASLGKQSPTIYSNSAVVPQPALELLTDRFVLPPWLPFANVFSIGDAVLAAGIVILIVRSMGTTRRPDPQASVVDAAH